LELCHLFPPPRNLQHREKVRNEERRRLQKPSQPTTQVDANGRSWDPASATAKDNEPKAAEDNASSKATSRGVSIEGDSGRTLTHSALPANCMTNLEDEDDEEMGT